MLLNILERINAMFYKTNKYPGGKWLTVTGKLHDFSIIKKNHTYLNVVFPLSTKRKTQTTTPTVPFCHGNRCHHVYPHARLLGSHPVCATS